MLLSFPVIIDLLNTENIYKEHWYKTFTKKALRNSNHTVLVKNYKWKGPDNLNENTKNAWIHEIYQVSIDDFPDYLVMFKCLYVRFELPGLKSSTRSEREEFLRLNRTKSNLERKTRWKSPKKPLGWRVLLGKTP